MKWHFFILPALLTVTVQAQNFSKITMSPLSSTPGDSRSVNWVDIDDDGFVDCMITNGLNGGQNNMLCLNNGSGGFTAVTGDSIVLDGKPSVGATWGDIDNDGDMDCFVTNWYNEDNLLYTRTAIGTYAKINTGILVNDAGYSETAAWGDYDNDGLLDLYVTNSATPLLNYLYRNQGQGNFLKITSGPMVTDAYPSRCVNWTDMDLDGDVDLFVTNEGNQNENIYRNDGGGTFTKIITGPLVNDGKHTMSSSWGDYDNDGDLDVFLANDLANNALFRNDGNFNFTKMISDTVSKEFGRSFSSAWSDVDNDGDLDLFVTNAYGPAVKRPCFFYLNNGGSFSRVSNHTLVNDSAWTYGCAFGDYDNDGFEDLAVATTRFGGVDYPDFLYHNDGNANKWITFKLVGIFSNHSAIGAKVRLKAVINGNPVWQLREISAQSSYCGQNDIRAHFGLGNATQVDSVIVEWPSGIVQYLPSLSTNQFINVIESGVPSAIGRNAGSTEGFKLFPNPSAGHVTVEPARGFHAGDILSLSDAEGKPVLEVKLSHATKQYRLELKKEHVQPGVYMISIRSQAGQYSQKLVIGE